MAIPASKVRAICTASEAALVRASRKSELDQLKSELESKRQDFESNGAPTVQGQPKRRWRDKLGLSGDE